MTLAIASKRISRMMLAAVLAVGAAQAADMTLEVRGAADGGLKLRDVEVKTLASAVAVSGRVQRAVALRSAAGRRVVVSVRGADGHQRAREQLAVTTLGLPRHGNAWTRFYIELPVLAQPGDVVSVALPAVGEQP
ncbi:MAG: hypothetical protein IPG43_17205 [Proteobacteria bacterium]|nr:hypothetical protein [Pseudomonadota bacterium]